MKHTVLTFLGVKKRETALQMRYPTKLPSAFIKISAKSKTPKYEKN